MAEGGGGGGSRWELPSPPLKGTPLARGDQKIDVWGDGETFLQGGGGGNFVNRSEVGKGEVLRINCKVPWEIHSTQI